jgi:condensin complex subunit 3
MLPLSSNLLDAESCVAAFLFHLGADPSAAVRRSVLNCIGRTNITLPHILERTRDIKDTVRRHAYDVLTKLTIRSLTIKQRERLLREGLKDRSGLCNKFLGQSIVSQGSMQFLVSCKCGMDH